MLKQGFFKRVTLLVAVVVAIGGGLYWHHESGLKRIAHISISKIHGQLREPAYLPFSIILGNEKILLIGIDGKMQLYDSKNGSSINLAEITGESVQVASANKLNKDDILITGWRGNAKTPFSMIYNAATSSISNTGVMNVPRVGYTTVQLNNGEILFAGGKNINGYVGTLEIFDPNKKSYQLLPVQIQAGESRRAINLRNGEVLFFGGENRDKFQVAPSKSHPRLNEANYFIKAIESFDPEANVVKTVSKWDASNDFVYQVLKDDRIFILFSNRTLNPKIYDPKRNEFQLVSNKLHIQRERPATALLPDGRVLIVGGYSCGYVGQSCPLGSNVVEAFEPKANKFQITGQTKRFYNRGSVIQSGNALFLIGAGSTEVEIYTSGV